MDDNSNMATKSTWFDKHITEANFGDKLSDAVVETLGSWKFIIIQTIIVITWVILNLIAFCKHWDPFPFILLNLLFSVQAAYTGPILLNAGSRQSDRDRIQAQMDYQTNLDAKKEIEALTLKLNSIEIEKLDKIITLLEGKKCNCNNS